MPKILITGASGFIGRKIIEAARKNSPEWEIWTMGRTPVAGMENLPLGTPTGKIPAFDAVIHALAHSAPAFCQDFWGTDDVNVGATKEMLRYCESRPGCRMVFLSSIILYGNLTPSPVPESAPLDFGQNNYSFSKGVAESYVRYATSKGLPGAILRLSNIYGPGQQHENSPFLVPEKIVQAVKEGKVTIRNASTVRDWLYVEDAADAIWRVAMDPSVDGVFNLGSGTGASAGEIGKIIAGRLGAEYEALNLPTSGPQNFFSDISKIRQATGWTPKIGIEEGVTRTIDDIKIKLCA